MTREELEFFYSLTGKGDRKIQQQVDELIAEAMSESQKGYLLMSGELMLEAHKIITGTLEKQKEHERSERELETFVRDLTQFQRGHGGFFD
jgi:hypothetical protein